MSEESYQRLKEAFDPTAFGALASRLCERLCEYLERAMDADPAMSVLPTVSPERMLEQLSGEFSADGEPETDIVDLLLEVVDRSTHLHHRGYVGHQVAAPLPPAVLAEFVNALLNNGMAVYEMGQAQTVMERQVVQFLAGRLGYDSARADGVLTHGGSLGNLTALLAARQATADYDAWTEGHREPLAVLVSEEAHYCVARAVQVMGLGRGGAVSVGVDDRLRMRPDDLEAALARARRDGRRVFAVVASSCSTATGSFDPLEPIAEFCQEHRLWMHVDGAHGASVALSNSERVRRERIAGIERADSVVWDLHKLALMPALATAVVFREGRRSYEAFAQEASYLFEDAAPEESWFDLGQRTMECTKRGMGMTLWVTLRSYGTRLFSEHVDRLLFLAGEFAAMLRVDPRFELLMEPEANIVCFRVLGAEPSSGPGPQRDLLQDRVRRQVLADGRFYLVKTRVRGATWLRTTLMNPLTTVEDLARLLEELASAAVPDGRATSDRRD